MLKYEMNKLFLKNKVIFFLPFLVLFGILITAGLYSKNTFSTVSSEEKYNEYMSEFAGKLTNEKEEKILAEQAMIIDAQNDEASVHTKLEGDYYKNRAEYEAELEPTKSITDLREPFNMLFERYSHALKDREKNYIIRGNYDCMTHDFPDFPLIFLMIFGVSALFLNEEYSRVITPIKISTNGQEKTLRAKISSLLILIVSCSAFRCALEFITLLNCGDFRDFSSPIQSIVYFENCTLNVSIIGGFFAIHAIRFLGYLFMSSFVILLAVTVRKGIFTVFIPFAWVILQQFVFYPSTPAYYMPTGLLRATGYLRGKYKRDEYNPESAIDGVEDKQMWGVIAFSVVFIFVVVFIAAKYYGTKIKTPRKPIMLAVVIALCCAVCGCSNNNSQQVSFNLTSIQEYEDYYFELNDGAITRISVIDNTRRKIAQDPFSSGEFTFSVCGDALYYCDNSFEIDEFAVYKVDLKTLKKKKIYSEDLNSSISFLGIDFYLEPQYIKQYTLVPFSNGQDLFLYSENGVEQIINGKRQILISEKIYKDRISFDGQRFYFINTDRKLICFDLRDKSQVVVCDEFACSVYCNDGRVLYSTQDGVFSLNDDFSSEKLCDVAADYIVFSEDHIVFSKDDTLYFLKDEPVKVFSGNFVDWNLLSGQNKVRIVYYEDEYMEELIDLK